jgi:hydrogenase/urease accessory protein HupE
MHPEHRTLNKPTKVQTYFCRIGLIIALVLVLAPGLGVAHPGDKGFATITLSGRSVLYGYWLPLSSFHPVPGEEAPADKPLDYLRVLRAVETQVVINANDAPCKPSSGVLTPPATSTGSIGVLVTFSCGPDAPRTLHIRDTIVEALSPGYVTLANIQWPGGSQQFVFQADTPEARIDLASGGSTRGLGSFFLLGIEHILAGWDHLLFLLSLLLLGGSFLALLKIITAFTVAHSITLAAAALELVVLPGRLVESAIALSIAYVAAENLWLRDRAQSKRWLVALIFGLVHGFGFSAVLKELALPRAGLLWSLLSFNLGVEAGQALVVAAAMPILLHLRTLSWRSRAVGTVSAGVLAVGVALFVERAFFGAG